MQIRIDTRDVTLLAVLWAQAPDIVGAEMLTAVREADLLIQGELQQKLPRGAGAIRGGAGLAGSIYVEETLAQTRAIGVVATALPYAVPVEVGTRPHFPPLQPIEDWVAAKLGIDNDAERRSVAFLIARKISREGTKADGTWQRVAEQTDAAVQAAIAAGVDRSLDRLGAPA